MMESKWLMPTLAGIVLTFVLNGPARAYRLLGPGAESCGAWTADRERPDRTKYIIDQSWVLGFLSALGNEGAGDPLHGLDSKAVAGWIDDYCQAKPLNDIANAAVALARAHPR